MNWKDSFPSENRYFETDRGILYNAEAIETMSKFPKKTFDAIITDPPYGTTACKWDTIIPFEDMWRELKRIRKDRTPIVLFGSEPFSSLLRVSNLKEYKYDWYWRKTKPSNYLNSKKQPRRRYEIVSVFYKKQCIYNPQGLIYGEFRNDRPGKVRKKVGKYIYGLEKHFGISKAKNYPTNELHFANPNNNLLHPTQKPLPLLEYLVKTYTNEGDLVLDFTCGSSTTLLACEKLNRRWVGIEIEEKYCEIAKQRIRSLKID